MCGGDRCPEAWGSRPLGPTAEMFIIDARAGTIGDEQLSWVVEAVIESHRTWKVGEHDIGKRSPTVFWVRDDRFYSPYEPPV